MNKPYIYYASETFSKEELIDNGEEYDSDEANDDFSEFSPYVTLDKYESDIKELQAQVQTMNDNCISINLHESRMMAAEERHKQELDKKDERIAELVRWHEKKDRFTQKLIGFISLLGPSWLPEGFRNNRRALLKEYGVPDGLS